jgi:hypothetical protein
MLSWRGGVCSPYGTRWLAAGVASKRIFAGPVGNRRLLCRQSPAECLEANRRIEVLIGTPVVSAARR